MKRTWVIVSLAIIAIIPAACGAAATAVDSKPARPVVTSTSKNLWADVVTINGYTYNCVWAEDGGLGLALWCDRVDSHG